LILIMGVFLLEFKIPHAARHVRIERLYEFVMSDRQTEEGVVATLRFAAEMSITHSR
jgi:hypothetical protein